MLFASTLRLCCYVWHKSRSAIAAFFWFASLATWVGPLLILRSPGLPPKSSTRRAARKSRKRPQSVPFRSPRLSGRTSLLFTHCSRPPIQYCIDYFLTSFLTNFWMAIIFSSSGYFLFNASNFSRAIV